MHSLADILTSKPEPAPDGESGGRKRGAAKIAVPRTIEWLSERGYTVDVAQHYNAASGRRKDLYNMFDLVAFDESHVIGVQVCCKDLSSHKAKVKENFSMVSRWLASPGRRFILFTWRPRKVKRGGKAVYMHGTAIEFDVGKYELVTRQCADGEEEYTWRVPEELVEKIIWESR